MSRLVETILTPQQKRANVRAVIHQLDDLGARGVPIPKELADAIPIVVAQLMRSQSERIKAAGAKLAIAALKHNLNLATSADKMSRLDEEMPTDITHGISITYMVDAPPNGNDHPEAQPPAA